VATGTGRLHDTLITGWAVAQTRDISHSIRKGRFWLLRGQNPWTDFDKTWHGWLCPGTTPHDNFGGV